MNLSDEMMTFINKNKTQVFEYYSNSLNIRKKIEYSNYYGSNSTITGPTVDGKCRVFDKSRQLYFSCFNLLCG